MDVRGDGGFIFVSRESPDVSAHFADGFIEGADVFLEGADVFLEGADVFLEGADIFLEGADIFLEGADIFLQAFKSLVDQVEVLIGGPYEGNVSSFYPPDVNSGKNSGVFAGPLAEFFPL